MKHSTNTIGIQHKLDRNACVATIYKKGYHDYERKDQSIAKSNLYTSMMRMIQGVH